MMKKLIFLCLVFTLFGCEKMTEQNGLLVFIREQNVLPIILEGENNNNKLLSLKEHLFTSEKLYDVVVIEGEEEILIAYRLGQLSRLKMKQVEEEVKEDAKEFLKSKKDIIVSSDYKIFLEAIRLHNDYKDNSNLEDTNKKFRWIIKLQKEMT